VYAHKSAFAEAAPSIAIRRLKASGVSTSRVVPHRHRIILSLNAGSTPSHRAADAPKTDHSPSVLPQTSRRPPADPGPSRFHSPETRHASAPSPKRRAKPAIKHSPAKSSVVIFGRQTPGVFVAHAAPAWCSRPPSIVIPPRDCWRAMRSVGAAASSSFISLFFSEQANQTSLSASRRNNSLPWKSSPYSKVDVAARVQNFLSRGNQGPRRQHFRSSGHMCLLDGAKIHYPELTHESQRDYSLKF